MKICPYCSLQNDDDALVCAHCQRAFAPAARRPATMAEGFGRPPVPPRSPTVPLETHRVGTHLEPPVAPSQPQRPPVSPPPAPALPPPVPPASVPKRRVTRLISDSPPNSAAGTMPALQSNVQPQSAASSRKIVAVLVTYSWDPQGRIFPIREGRNLIGRNQECDICVPEDDALSGINSHITYRRSFTIGDMVSMGGTDLNGEPIEEQFRSLENYAQIRTGSTYWTILMLPSAENKG